MPVFVYKARDELGKQIKGVMEAKNRETLSAGKGSKDDRGKGANRRVSKLREQI